ncbi:hypothetical protein IE53DRAFT_260626 [Violaceomyces palustris]|uniref:Uncharacterized protein n=1 Tax=Violaceomyces palustris TaxID=1673888 RepID=A0ACD0P3U6_9BASI|nr:hypothetical protein IE53DRAFT_260626 [Violaceomyces palustris]
MVHLSWKAPLASQQVSQRPARGRRNEGHLPPFSQGMEALSPPLNLFFLAGLARSKKSAGGTASGQPGWRSDNEEGEVLFSPRGGGHISATRLLFYEAWPFGLHARHTMKNGKCDAMGRWKGGKGQSSQGGKGHSSQGALVAGIPSRPGLYHIYRWILADSPSPSDRPFPDVA